MIIADVDLDLCRPGKTRTFDFGRHRRVEHYARILEQTGVVEPARLSETRNGEVNQCGRTQRWRSRKEQRRHFTSVKTEEESESSFVIPTQPKSMTDKLHTKWSHQLSHPILKLSVSPPRHQLQLLWKEISTTSCLLQQQCVHSAHFKREKATMLSLSLATRTMH